MYVHDCADELVGLHGAGAKVGLATVAKLSELLGSTKVLPRRLGTRRREARRGATLTSHHVSIVCGLCLSGEVTVLSAQVSIVSLIRSSRMAWNADLGPGKAEPNELRRELAAVGLDLSLRTLKMKPHGPIPASCHSDPG